MLSRSLSNYNLVSKISITTGVLALLAATHSIVCQTLNEMEGAALGETLQQFFEKLACAAANGKVN